MPVVLSQCLVTSLCLSLLSVRFFHCREVALHNYYNLRKLCTVDLDVDIINPFIYKPPVTFTMQT